MNINLEHLFSIDIFDDFSNTLFSKKLKALISNKLHVIFFEYVDDL